MISCSSISFLSIRAFEIFDGILIFNCAFVVTFYFLIILCKLCPGVKCTDICFQIRNRLVSIDVDGVSYVPKPETLTLAHHYSTAQAGNGQEVVGEAQDGGYHMPTYLIVILALILTVATVSTAIAVVSTRKKFPLIIAVVSTRIKFPLISRMNFDKIITLQT